MSPSMSLAVKEAQCRPRSPLNVGLNVSVGWKTRLMLPHNLPLLRVRADLIDRLENEAGELSIARARIEGEMRSLKTSLG